MQKVILSVFLVLFSKKIFATNSIGEITKLRGEVSILELGAHQAELLTLGKKVNEEASILTKEKSFVQITMKDNSTVNLGPNSKMILTLTETKKVGLINLVKGVLRANVKNENSNKNKLLIYTRSAALGIRGTEFLANYNPDNEQTNLITFKGSVAFKENKNSNLAKTEENLEEVKIFVNKGETSFINTKVQKVIEPISISAKQYTNLKLNEELDESFKADSKILEKELENTIKTYKENAKEKMINQNSNIRGGGQLDLATGIYISPDKDQSKYDPRLKIYTSNENKGTIEASGFYSAPKGFKLDSRNGFVLIGKENLKEDYKKLEILNESIVEVKANIPEKKPSLEDLKDIEKDPYQKFYKK